MADDKGDSGGGSAWGVFEIVIGIVLVIGLLDRISGKADQAPSSPNDKTVMSETEGSRCGIYVGDPAAGEKITGMIRVSGTVGSCDWKSTAQTAVYAQVVDAKGKNLSDYLAIPPSGDARGRKVNFDQMVAMTGIPSTSTGYLILIPAVPNRGKESVSLRIPLTFSK